MLTQAANALSTLHSLASSLRAATQLLHFSSDTAGAKRRRLPVEGPDLSHFLQNPASNLQQQGKPNAANQGKSVFIETYGCQMNVSDSEIIASVLAAAKFTKAETAQEAGVVLLNTCAIRENAEARIWGRLHELRGVNKQRRAHNQPPLLVGVLGCMAERLKSRLLEQQRLADLVVGPDAYRDLPRIIAAVQAGEAQGPAAMNVQLSLEETYADIMPVRQAGSSSNSAFVSIMRGCNNMCAFCIVPFTRGRERSRPLTSILREVEALSEQGVKEVTLLGQNVNSYADFSHKHQQEQQHQQPGSTASDQSSEALSSSSRSRGGDGSSSSSSSSLQQQQQQAPFAAYAPGFVSVYKPVREGAMGFAELLQQVAHVNPEMRVRFTSPHPKDFTDQVLEVIASLPNVCNYLHMPAQSGSSSVLDRMRRGYSREAYDSLVKRARLAVPNVALSTDIITGFCGETDEEHAATVDLLLTTRYDNAFLFAYSQRDKTYAARHLPDDVPEEVKAARLAELFAAYRQGQAELNAAEVGRVHLVLLDGRPRRANTPSLQGRTCSMKRAILPEQPLPSSLMTLRQHTQQQQQQQRTAAAAVYTGPLSSVGVGDYVAVLVQQVAGHATLMSQPLAKTSIEEFAAVFGSGTPTMGQVPDWVARAAGLLQPVEGPAAEAVETAAALAAGQ